MLRAVSSTRLIINTNKEHSRLQNQRMTIALMKENETEGNTEPVPRPGSTFLSKHQCSDSNNNMADSSDVTDTTQNASSSESNEDQSEQRGLPPVRPPPRPPAPSAEAVKRNSLYGRSNPALKPSESSANIRTMTPAASGSVESFSSIFEDLDEMESILMEGNQSDVNVQSVSRPSDGNNNTVVSSDLTDPTENASSSERNEDQPEQRGLPPVRPPPRPPAPSAEAVTRNSLYRSNPAVKAALMEEKASLSQVRDGNTDTADSSDLTDATENDSSPERNQHQAEQRGLHPVRPPPRPPAPSVEAVKRNSFYGGSNPSVKPSELSGTSRTTTLTANSSEESFSFIYKDLDETGPIVMDENQVEVHAPSVPHPSDSNNNMADSSDKTVTTENATSSESNEDQPEQRGLPPVRPPPRPPAPSTEAVKRNSVYGRSNPAVKPAALSSVKLPPRRPSRPLPPQRPPLPPLYCDRLRPETAPDPEDDTDAPQQSRSSSTSSMEQAPEHSHVYEDTLDFAEAYSGNASPAVVPALQQSDLFDSPLACELSPQQNNRPPTPPSFSPLTLLPSADEDSLHNEAESPIYVEILPDESEEMHITSLLRWLRKMSKTDCMAPSLYGLSIDEEMRSFHKRAVNVTKALRLYNHLMIKRKDNLKNILTEFKAICGTLDKIQKKNRTMSIAGGTTGAVGGMTAVMGIALAPATIGASLVATLVGAGMVASAGAMGAHAAKANKKIVDRVTVEKLLYDYKANIIDLELCLHFILVGMNELRRHDVARLHRAGAEPEAVKMAHRSEAVYRYNTKNSRATSTPNTSEKLLLAFVKEMDQYFSERDVTLRKSTKSKFSGRVCLLAENLQDELDYLNDMWGIFSS